MTVLVIDETPGVVAAPARLLAWAEAANGGDRFVYATRCSLPPGSAGAAVVRTLEARGLVLLSRWLAGSADATGRVWSYFAERSSKPWPSTPARRPTLTRPEPELLATVERAAVDQVYPLVRRAAQFGRPCPTPAQIAARCELAPSLVTDAWAALRSLGLIAVSSAPPPTDRIVTIVENGWRTGLAA